MAATVIVGYDNALESLQQEHEVILEVFEIFKAAAGAARVQPFAELKARVRQHMDAEEDEFYPHVRALGVDQDTIVDTAETEHDAIEAALAAIEAAGAQNASAPQVTTLENALKNHIRSERGTLFDAARDGLTLSQLREIEHRIDSHHDASILK